MVTEFGEGDLFQILEDDTTLPESEVKRSSLYLLSFLSLTLSSLSVPFFPSLSPLSTFSHFPTDSNDCCPTGVCPLLLTFKEDTP